MTSFLAVIRPPQGASPALLRRHRIYFDVFLTLLGVGVGGLSLLLAAWAYVPLKHAGVFAAYFLKPLLVLLNLLPAVALIWLGCFLFRRAWAAYLFSAVPVLGFSLVNYYKIRLRGDPLLAVDLRLARTARGIIGHYTLDFTRMVLFVALVALAMLLFAVFLLPDGPRGAWLRVGGALACLALLAVSYARLYTDNALYRKTAIDHFVNPWSDVEAFVSRGFWYPFLHSVPDMFPTPPEGYSEQDAAATLAAYSGSDIPANKRVNVVGVMLEAFSDLSDFDALAGQEGVAALYAPLHGLEAQSVSGNLLTNIFAGGTVDSEWGFLSGYSEHDGFRADTDSYVRYFKSQGYDTLYRHPGYGWFYNRQNVNQYLGFDESAFTDSGFGELVSPESAPYRSDAVLFDYLLRDLDARTAEDAPLFLFSVSYQNHGPYDSTPMPDGVVSSAAPGWSEESCGILDHYLDGVADTIGELVRFTDALEARREPVVLVVFGDHKPWLGNGNSVYQELGVDLDVSTPDGFYNYYATPYFIWANSAAKAALGADFTGDGGDFSPCFLMPELFDACSWEGPAFMALSREMRALSPLVHERGLFLENGALTDAPSQETAGFYRQYRCAEFWRETKGLQK